MMRMAKMIRQKNDALEASSECVTILVTLFFPPIQVSHSKLQLLERRNAELHEMIREMEWESEALHERAIDAEAALLALQAPQILTPQKQLDNPPTAAVAANMEATTHDDLIAGHDTPVHEVKDSALRVSTAASREDYRKALFNYFTTHSPKKVAKVDTILDTYASKPDGLSGMRRDLEKKYKAPLVMQSHSEHGSTSADRSLWGVGALSHGPESTASPPTQHRHYGAAEVSPGPPRGEAAVATCPAADGGHGQCFVLEL